MRYLGRSDVPPEALRSLAKCLTDAARGPTGDVGGPASGARGHSWLAAGLSVTSAACEGCRSGGLDGARAAAESALRASPGGVTSAPEPRTRSGSQAALESKSSLDDEAGGGFGEQWKGEAAGEEEQEEEDPSSGGSSMAGAASLDAMEGEVGGLGVVLLDALCAAGTRAGERRPAVRVTIGGPPGHKENGDGDDGDWLSIADELLPMLQGQDDREREGGQTGVAEEASILLLAAAGCDLSRPKDPRSSGSRPAGASTSTQVAASLS